MQEAIKLLRERAPTLSHAGRRSALHAAKILEHLRSEAEKSPFAFTENLVAVKIDDLISVPLEG